MEQWLAKINKLTAWQAAIIIAVIGFAVFFTGLTNPFLQDDLGQIVNNPVVHSIRNFPLFFEGGTFYQGNGIAPLGGLYYRPLMTTVFSLLYTLFGPRTVFFHVLQLTFIIGSAVLLYMIFERLLNPLLALILSLVFLVHPMNSQIAFYMPNMQDALFLFFGLLAFWFLIRFDSVKSLWLVVACLFLSLLSKEAGVLFAAVSVMYLLWSDRDRVWRFAAMLVPLAAAYLTLFLHARAVGLSRVHPEFTPLDRMSLMGRLMNAPSIMVFYISKFILPLKLASGYYWGYPNFTVRHVLLPIVIDIVVIALIVYVAYLIRRRVSVEQHAAFIFFALWSAVGLVPYLQVFPLDLTASETWFYFSMAGILGMIGVLLVALKAYIHPNVFIAVAAVVICILGVRTLLRGTEWSNAFTLARHDIAASKEDYEAYYQLAIVSIDKGDYNQAKVYAAQSVNLFPNFENYNDLGFAAAKLGEYDQAEQAYDNGVKYSGAFNTLYENLAELALVYGNPTVNKLRILEGLRQYPHDSFLWAAIAILEYKYGSIRDAQTDITTAVNYGQVPSFIYDAIMHSRPFMLQLPNIKTSIAVQPGSNTVVDRPSGNNCPSSAIVTRSCQ